LSLRRFKWRPKAKMVLAYIIVVVLAMGFALDPRVLLPQEPALPVFSPVENAKVPSKYREFLAALDYPRVSLLSTLPGLTQWYEGSDEAVLPRAGEMALQALAGVDPRDPGSILRAALPALFSSPASGWASPVPDTPVTAPPPISEEVKKPERTRSVLGEPLVGIYHTHARESFLPDMHPPSTNYDDAHSWDMSITVVEIGRHMAQCLDQHGIAVVHSTVIHDDPGKLGAYLRSLTTAEQMMADNPSLRVLLDIHRDARPRKDTTISFLGRQAARVMVVLGTDQRLPHPEWKRNYEFALDLVRHMEHSYPGLSLGIYPKSDRYNQHLSPGALLLEVGGVENTLDECLYTAEILAETLARMVEYGDLP
jgi:stage II sporulation protein P